MCARSLSSSVASGEGMAAEPFEGVAFADVVPLQGENRRLVREGLKALAATRKIGLRALMEVARVDPSGLDESAIGFRLGPRLNASGRLYRADAGLELLLTEDGDRARSVAAELDEGGTARRRGIESVFDLLLDEQLQVGVKLCGQFFFSPRLAKQVAPETGETWQ